ncbi:putative 5-methyltetrahydrofolate--homocystein methyltransferase MetH domain protein [Mycobacterium xenopi 4042]|uniref:Putative 5-methyltetrahydrofolate--homocystein methyltransferase MetH domain protein n=1 Tax=Mycobacterium xenopi 4042 TaxID=1299334 RepID=X8BD82_MYCXE|nr:putative 5-methyltetrahydrofolate--homocystein methyltransferase MetH domain protein [Mycobacterium xenopi 4042]EUA44346.1 putative 5-methyltetrahydrofolate--homocystein methyltransferase MetH domain protein [Mycobacterium xenopi 3993]
MLAGVTLVNDHAYDTDLLDALAERVMVGDGAMGTQLQAAELTLDDFRAWRAATRSSTRPAPT